MKIVSDTTRLSATHQSVRTVTTEAGIRAGWENAWANATPFQNQATGSNRLSLNRHIREMQQQVQQWIRAARSRSGLTIRPLQLGTAGSLTAQDLFNRIMELLNPEQSTGSSLFSFNSERIRFSSLSLSGATRSLSDYNYGSFFSTETVSQSTSTSFSAEGQATLADGRTLDYTVHFSVEQEWMKQTVIEEEASHIFLLDPLVLSLDGGLPSFSDTLFAFDLNDDGIEEQIAMPEIGTGFLAFDRNRDGSISSGNELFGPRTGDGFLELRQWDADQNNWIDENDPIFNELSVWHWDPESGEVLESLDSAGIGAIHLGSVQTPVDHLSKGGEYLARIRSSGFFLNAESGQAGILQHADLNCF